MRVPTDQLMAAAATLVRAGQWDVAAGLMEAAEPDDPAEAAGLALALAEAAVDRDFWRGSRGSAAVLARAEAVLGQSSDPVPAFDLDLLRLQRDYAVALFGSGDGSAPEGGGHQTGELDRRAAALREAAPDRGRAGRAAFWGGLVADNLRGDPAAAAVRYEEALVDAERAGDELLAGRALRHLGDHAHTAGDLALARKHWERAHLVWAGLGYVPGVLAQCLLLATLARDEGHPRRAAGVAAEVARWAAALDLPWLRAQAETLGDALPGRGMMGEE